MKFLSLLIAAVAMSGISCERHDFHGPDGTSQLQHGHGDSHGEVHAGEDEHAPAVHH